MSWWDGGLSNFANQATQALQQAQKRIDKALDIQENEGAEGGTNQESSASSSSSLSKQKQLPSKANESGGEDTFWNSWLPDAVPSSEVKTPGKSPQTLSGTSSKEGTPTSEEKKSKTSLIENRKRASERLGLRKSRKKSEEEMQSASPKLETATVDRLLEDVAKTSATDSKKESKSTDNIALLGDSMTSKPASTVKSVVEQTYAISEDAPKTHYVDDKTEDSPVKAEKEISAGQLEARKVETVACRNVEEATKTENEEVNYSKDEPDSTAVEQSVPEDNQKIVEILDDGSDTSNAVVKENTPVLESVEKDESVHEKSVPTFEDNSNLGEDGQSWGQDLMDVDLSLADQEENANVTLESKVDEELDKSLCDIPLDATTYSNPRDETEHGLDEAVPETVIETKTEETETMEITETHVNEEVQNSSENTLSVEPMTDSLSDSKSECSVVEKTQMQVSTESGTTTSEEPDDYNRTLTEEDFKKMTDVAQTSSVSESVTDQEKTSPEHTGTSSLTSSGYVKNMLEEAMVESLKESDSHSDRSSDKSSDMVRIESGMNSGHTSGDEIDTTTSSDIEIISTPTPNGEYKVMDRPFDLSPLRHALSNTVRRGGSPPGHKRSDSGSSAQSNWSKNGDELLSPEGAVQKHVQGAEGQNSSMAYPLETEKLLKDDNGTNKPLQPIAEKYEPLDPSERTLHVPPPIYQDDDANVKDLKEKLADMAEIIEHRERKLVEMSKQNIDLQESNTILRNQLQQSEESREAEMSDLNEITNEFTERLSESEKKLNQVLREKETVKKQLEQARNELYKTTDVTTSAENMLRDKDQQISELMEEGQKLMKQQLQTNNILKKLRVKEKETDSTNKSQKEKLQKQKVELEHLQKVLDAKEELEKKQIEAINQLNNAVKKQEMEIDRMTSDLEDAQEKNRSMQVILDNSYKEIAELHKANAAKNSEAQQVALSTEMQAKEELRLALERQQLQSKYDQEALVTQIEDLRLSITRMEKENGRREDVLRQEISDLQQRLQEAEGRNQELTQGISAATKPLLRQIENLQSTYTAQTLSYEKVEKNLTDRLADAQGQLAAAMEKERLASDKVIDISAKLTSLESQVGSLRQEKSRLSAELEMGLAKAEVLEEAKLTESAQREAARRKTEQDIIELKKEKVLLNNQLELEKMKVEAERKKLLLAHEQLREKELLLERKSPSPGLALSRNASFVSDTSMSMSTSFTQDEILEKTLMTASTNGNKTSLYESLRNTGATSLLENLQSQLKQKEGEITQLQSEIIELERTRESMARELVNLSTENERLQEEVDEYPEFKSKYQEMDSRYQALLQMYGEKVEETDELRLDLQDVKEMYKAQINELLKSR